MKLLLLILVKKDQPATFSVVTKTESKREKEKDKRWRGEPGQR